MATETEELLPKTFWTDEARWVVEASEQHYVGSTDG